jgi:5'-nucleotidase
VRVLVTNDDGVHAPGLRALVGALARWSEQSQDRDVIVVAPLANYSGASAAVGTVYERESVGCRRIRIEGAEEIPVYGVDAPPALTVVIGTYGAFGPKPDVIISGINLGVNVGRSVLHSGTVGAALTAAQHGFRGLAVSLRSQADQHQWDTAAELALGILPIVAEAPPKTVLNLNVPNLALADLRGVVAAGISDAGIIKGAHAEMQGDTGTVKLVLGTAIPTLGDTTGEDPTDDAALVGAGYASLTALHGVGEDRGAGSRAVVERALRAVSELVAR